MTETLIKPLEEFRTEQLEAVKVCVSFKHTQTDHARVSAVAVHFLCLWQSEGGAGVGRASVAHVPNALFPSGRETENKTGHLVEQENI